MPGEADHVPELGRNGAKSNTRLDRRSLLVGVAAGVIAGATVGVGGRRVWDRLQRSDDPTAGIPDVPVGAVTLEEVPSSARGIDVGLYTAVPADHGDGAGLPVCVVLHGASATVSDFERFGFAQFLTAVVRSGTPPFVLVGADGGRQRWEAVGANDPQRMVLDKIPVWAADRGFDSTRSAGWGWSMGGYGVIRAAEVDPSAFVAIAAFSPALGANDAAVADAPRLAGTPIGIWCGTDDALFPAVEAFTDSLPEPPSIRSFSPGGHTREYWNSRTLEALAFIGNALTPRAPG